MFLKIILVLVALVLGLIAVAALRPAHFTVTRSIRIAAPPAVVFPYVNTAKAWEAWSPFGNADPGMKVAYEGPPAGVGAITVFDGRKSGTGRSVIVESRDPDLIRMKLEMLKPMRATNDVRFTFQSAAGETVVTWSMRGESNLVMRIVGLFINCDKMVGDEFDRGLAALKTSVERRQAIPARPAGQ